MRTAILDTSVYINHWRSNFDSAAYIEIRRTYIVRQSAVVLSELWRGAHTRESKAFVESLRRMCKDMWEPTAEDWWDAGHLIRKIGNTHDWDTSKRREFQNDALIALTARRHGATVITSNRNDFELLQAEVAMNLLVL